MRHHPSGLPHEFADGSREASGARTLRLVPMASFVMPHGFDDRPAANVSRRKPVEVTAQVSFHLSLGFRDES